MHMSLSSRTNTTTNTTTPHYYWFLHRFERVLPHGELSKLSSHSLIIYPLGHNRERITRDDFSSENEMTLRTMINFKTLISTIAPCPTMTLLVSKLISLDTQTFFLQKILFDRSNRTYDVIQSDWRIPDIISKILSWKFFHLIDESRREKKKIESSLLFKRVNRETWIYEKGYIRSCLYVYRTPMWKRKIRDRVQKGIQ